MRNPACPQAAEVMRPDDKARQYAQMIDGFRASGGVLSGDQMALHLRTNCQQPISALARWIVDRQVLSFEWQTQILVPLFQFGSAPVAPRDGMRSAISELSEVFDDWDLAAWFARPNAWLNNARPADEIARDALAVFHAARADRFVALG